MKLFLKNTFYRYSTLASFFNQFGSAIYNLVFVIYVANTYHSPLLISIANIITMVPSLFQIWIGPKADQTSNRAHYLLGIGLIQTLYFILVAWFTKQVNFLAFVLICLLNIFSDCLSQFSSGLLLPIMKHHIVSYDLMEAYSFRSVLSYTYSLGGQAFGVWLLTISHNNFTLIAWINAGSFLLSSLILYRIRKLLAIQTLLLKQESLKRQLQQMYHTSKKIFTTTSDSQFLMMLGAMIVSNVIGNGLISLYNIYFLNHQFWSLDYSQILFIIQTVMIFGTILGGLFTHDYFSKKSLHYLLTVQLIGYFTIAILSLIETPFLIILCIFGFNCYLVGKFNPKFSTTLMHNVPDGQLAQVSSFISFLVTLSIPLGVTLFSMISLANIQFIWILLILGLGSLLILLATSRKF